MSSDSSAPVRTSVSAGLIHYYCVTNYFNHLKTYCTTRLRDSSLSDIDRSELLFWLSFSLLNSGDPAACLSTLQPLTDQAAECPIALPVTALAISSSNQLPNRDRSRLQALKLLLKTVSKSSSDFSLALASRYFLYSGKYEKSRQCCEKLLAKDKRNAHLISLLGLIMLQEYLASPASHALVNSPEPVEIDEKILNLFRKAMKLTAPQFDFFALWGRFTIMEREGKLSKCLTELDSILELFGSEFPCAEEEKAKILWLSGRCNDAVVLAKTVLKRRFSIRCHQILLLDSLVTSGLEKDSASLVDSLRTFAAKLIESEPNGLNEFHLTGNLVGSLCQGDSALLKLASRMFDQVSQLNSSLYSRFMKGKQLVLMALHGESSGAAMSSSTLAKQLEEFDSTVSLDSQSSLASVKLATFSTGVKLWLCTRAKATEEGEKWKSALKSSFRTLAEEKKKFEDREQSEENGGEDSNETRYFAGPIELELDYWMDFFKFVYEYCSVQLAMQKKEWLKAAKHLSGAVQRFTTHNRTMKSYGLYYYFFISTDFLVALTESIVELMEQIGQSESNSEATIESVKSTAKPVLEYTAVLKSALPKHARLMAFSALLAFHLGAVSRSDAESDLEKARALRPNLIEIKVALAHLRGEKSSVDDADAQLDKKYNFDEESSEEEEEKEKEKVKKSKDKEKEKEKTSGSSESKANEAKKPSKISLKDDSESESDPEPEFKATSPEKKGKQQRLAVPEPRANAETGSPVSSTVKPFTASAAPQSPSHDDKDEDADEDDDEPADRLKLTNINSRVAAFELEDVAADIAEELEKQRKAARNTKKSDKSSTAANQTIAGAAVSDDVLVEHLDEESFEMGERNTHMQKMATPERNSLGERNPIGDEVISLIPDAEPVKTNDTTRSGTPAVNAASRSVSASPVQLESGQQTPELQSIGSESSSRPVPEADLQRIMSSSPNQQAAAVSASQSSAAAPQQRVRSEASQALLEKKQRIMYAGEQIELAKAFCRSAYWGEIFIKHGRRGSPHERNVVLEVVGSVIKLDWSSGNLKAHKNDIKLLDGKQTPVFQRPSAAKAKPELCFSVVIASRSLDLEARNLKVKEHWYHGLELLLKYLK